MKILNLKLFLSTAICAALGVMFGGLLLITDEERGVVADALYETFPEWFWFVVTFAIFIYFAVTGTSKRYERV